MKRIEKGEKFLLPCTCGRSNCYQLTTPERLNEKLADLLVWTSVKQELKLKHWKEDDGHVATIEEGALRGLVTQADDEIELGKNIVEALLLLHETKITRG